MDIAPDTEVPRLLSFLFLAFGTVTDGELVPEELEIMAERLKRWIPEGAYTDLVEFVEQAAALYDAHESEKSVWSSASDFARLLRDRLDDPAQRAEVIADLVYIARADRVICEGEVTFIRRVMEIFEIDGPDPLAEGPCEAPPELEGEV
ncbi:MAG: TerB family tellurite resistance protein [Myxococcales bacterium]|nr:TerB family tellurite resistance protein [Myxococcales bacterium]